MKKTAKSALLIILMTSLIIALTGCGRGSNKDSSNNESANKLVASKDANDEFFGEHKEIIEVTFDASDNAEKIDFIYELSSEETAKSVASLFAMASSSEQYAQTELKHEGKRFIMSMKPAAFVEQKNIEEGQLSKESLKTLFESEGYTVE